MPRGKPGEEYQKWLARERQRLQELAKDRTRLLPPDLQAGILEACEDEREWLVERIETIDGELEKLDEMIEAATEAQREAMTVIEPPPKTVRKTDGTVRTIEPTPIRMKSEAAIKAGRRVRALKNHRLAFEQERQGRRGQIREVNRVQKAAEDGVVTGLLEITQRWRNEVDLHGLQPKISMGKSYTDRMGNELPSEALNSDGTPADLPSAKEAREGK